MQGTAAQMAGPMMAIFWIIYLAIIIFFIIVFWKIFVKAGKPGWAAIIPIYNIIVLLQIIGKPVWWIILLFIPIVNIVIYIIMLIELAKKFGMPGWHWILMLLFGIIYFPILAFGSAKYKA